MTNPNDRHNGLIYDKIINENPTQQSAAFTDL